MNIDISAPGEDRLKENTHEFSEGRAPLPLVPRQLPYALKLDEESSLEVEELVEAREEQMDSILVYRI